MYDFATRIRPVVTRGGDSAPMVQDDDDLTTARGCLRSSVFLAALAIGLAGVLMYLSFTA